MNYIMLEFTHPTFNHMAVTIIKIPSSEYSPREYAIKTACKEYKVKSEEITVYSCKSIGRDVRFII